MVWNQETNHPRKAWGELYPFGCCYRAQVGTEVALRQTRGRESAARRPQRTRSRGPALGSGCSKAVHLAPSLAQEEAEVTAVKAVGSILMPQARLRSCPGEENSNQPAAWLKVVQSSVVKA